MHQKHPSSYTNSSSYSNSIGSPYSSNPNTANSDTANYDYNLKRRSNLGQIGSNIIKNQDTGYDNINKYAKPSNYNEISKLKSVPLDPYKNSNYTPSYPSAAQSPTSEYWRKYSSSNYTNDEKKSTTNDVTPKRFVGGLNETMTSQKAKRDVSDYQSKADQRSAYSREKDENSTSLIASPDFSTIGLENIGNTWYMNVVLQWLFHLKEFNKIFVNESYKKLLNSSQSSSSSICIEYSTLLKKTKEPKTASVSRSRLNWKNNIQDYVSTRDFKEEIWTLFPSFKGYDQHDAHEFWTTLLDVMSKELNRVTTKPKYSEITVSSKDDLDKQAQKWFDYYK